MGQNKLASPTAAMVVGVRVRLTRRTPFDFGKRDDGTFDSACIVLARSYLVACDPKPVKRPEIYVRGAARRAPLIMTRGAGGSR